MSFKFLSSLKLDENLYIISFRYRSYGNENFDFLLFTQCYPITSCIVGESSMEKCHFAADREAWTIHGIW